MVFIEYLISQKGLTEQSAKAYAKPSQKGKPISDLIDADIIEGFANGWIVKHDYHASAMMVSGN